MANKWAIANGNWSDGSTWNDGVVPMVDDDVWLNGKTIDVDCDSLNLIEVKSLHNDICNITGLTGGLIQVSNASSTNYFNISANCYGDRLINFYSCGFTNINGKCTSCRFAVGGNGKYLNINGDCDDVLIESRSSGSTRYLTINGKITIGKDKPMLDDSTYVNATLLVTINGELIMNDNFTYGANNHPITLSGVLRVMNPLITINANLTLNGTLDVTKANGKIPVPTNRTFNFGRQTESYVAYITDPDVPQSVVLEGYEYGDKVGTLKTVPDNVAIVNLTEQEVNRVKNCATVSTVQKCFEEFKEE